MNHTSDSPFSNSAIRVLVVDDEPALSRIIKLSLEKLGTFEVTLISDPLIAVQTATHCQPHVALLDVMMPHKNGVQVAHSLRNTPDFEHLPIVFLSACVMKRGETYWINTDEGMYKQIEDPLLRSCTLLEKPVMIDHLIKVLTRAAHSQFGLPI
jgi:CheY-like chemotaxis protein